MSKHMENKNAHMLIVHTHGDIRQPSKQINKQLQRDGEREREMYIYIYGERARDSERVG